MGRIVICMNDYPYAVMPEGSTAEEAQALCKQLQDRDERNIEARRQYPGMKPPATRSYYHAHDVPEIVR